MSTVCWLLTPVYRLLPSESCWSGRKKHEGVASEAGANLLRVTPVASVRDQAREIKMNRGWGHPRYNSPPVQGKSGRLGPPKFERP
jgi:hypothetical protein